MTAARFSGTRGTGFRSHWAPALIWEALVVPEKSRPKTTTVKRRRAMTRPSSMPWLVMGISMTEINVSPGVVNARAARTRRSMGMR